MIMFQLRHHGETHCHSQPSVMATWQTGVAGGTHITAALSARQDMCEATLYWIIYHRNSCQTTRFDYFFLPCNWGWGKSAKLFAQVGHECRWQCQLQRETVTRKYARPHALGIGLGPTSLVEPDCVSQETHCDISDSLVVRNLQPALVGMQCASIWSRKVRPELRERAVEFSARQGVVFSFSSYIHTQTYKSPDVSQCLWMLRESNTIEWRVNTVRKTNYHAQRTKSR